MDGKNVMDFFDADIEDKLRSLEAEEAELEAQGMYAPEEEGEDELDENELALYRAVKEQQALARAAHSVKSTVPRKFTAHAMDADDIREHLESRGLESEGVLERMQQRGRKRTRSHSASAGSDEGMDMDGAAVRQRSRSAHDRSVSVQSRSRTRGPRDGSVAPHQEKQVKKLGKTEERRNVKYARAGTSDREHYPKLVKHLNSGKRSLGTSTIGR